MPLHMMIKISKALFGSVLKYRHAKTSLFFSSWKPKVERNCTRAILVDDLITCWIYNPNETMSNYPALLLILWKTI